MVRSLTLGTPAEWPIFQVSGIRRPPRRAYIRTVRAGAERGVDKIARLAKQPVDLVRLWQECTSVIADYVPYYRAPCWYTLDPASLLFTSHFHDGLPEFPAEWLAGEYYEYGANKLADVARSESGINTLHEAVAGDPSDDPRWHRNMTMGGDQEVVVRLRSKSGQVWGALALYRDPGRPAVRRRREELPDLGVTPPGRGCPAGAAARRGHRSRRRRRTRTADPQP
jgi:hypothetical protein